MQAAAQRCGVRAITNRGHESLANGRMKAHERRDDGKTEAADVIEAVGERAQRALTPPQ